MDWITTVGMIAGICTTLAFVPQVLQVYKSRSAKDISLGMYAIFISGVVLWLIYGVMINALPIILANAVTLFLAGAILMAKLRFG